MKKEQNLNKDMLILSALTLVTILTWIGFDVLRNLGQRETPRILKEQLEPLSPNFDMEAIKDLREGTSFSQEELDSIPETPRIALEEPKELQASPSQNLNLNQ